MNEINYIRGSSDNPFEMGNFMKKDVPLDQQNGLSNTAYVRLRFTEATSVMAQLLASSMLYDWKTIAGMNCCTKMELKGSDGTVFVTVNENSHHDYLPRWRVVHVNSPDCPEYYASDYMDVIAHILRTFY